MVSARRRVARRVEQRAEVRRRRAAARAEVEAELSFFANGRLDHDSRDVRPRDDGHREVEEAVVLPY